jgi:chemotaxis signal transduction protein
MDVNTSFYQHPWVILKLEHELYGIAAPHVQTMVAMPDITYVPHQASWNRGVINLRGQIIPLIDLRLRLGMPSFITKIEGLIDMVREREKDHLNWLTELESSVREKREFKLTTDPHKCKFGQWYDNYKPVTLTERQLFQEFDAPHRRIHGLAEKVRRLITENKADQALSMIEKTRDGDFAVMRNLFGKFLVLMQEQVRTEIALVLANQDQKLVAVAVDAIESVEMLADGSVEDMPQGLQHKENLFTPHVAKRKKRGDIVFLLDLNRLIAGAYSRDAR